MAIINRRFIDIFSPREVFLIFELFEEINEANRLHEELFNKYFGVDTALRNVINPIKETEK